MSVLSKERLGEAEPRSNPVRSHIQAKVSAIRRASLREVLSRQLVRNIASGPVASLLIAVLTAATYPVYLYYLGLEGYGLWIILGTIPSFAQFGNIGVAPAITRMVACEFGKQNFAAITEYVSTALIGLAGTGVAVVVAIVLLKGSLVSFLHLSPSNGGIAKTMIPFCALLAVYVFQVEALLAALSGLGRIDIANYARVVSTTICLASAVLFFKFQLGIVAPVLASAIAYVVLHIVTILSIQRVLGRSIFAVSAFRRARLRPLLRFGGGMFTCSIVTLLVAPLNRLMLARYGGLAVVPVYDIAFNASMQFRTIIESAIRATMPEISRLSSAVASSAAAIRRISKNAVALVWMLGAPMYAALYLGARPLLKLWLRGRFQETMPAALQIMIIGAFASLLGVPAFYKLVATGRIRDLVFGNLIQSGVNALIVLSSLLLFSRANTSIFLWSTAIGMGAGALYLIRANSRASA
jgi:O-antigen/teichoic acid export membrane protein